MSIIEKEAIGGLNSPVFEFGIGSHEMATFAGQFVTMIGSGIPLVLCLKILRQQTENPTFKRIITQVCSDVESGMAFSKSLENLVQAGDIGSIQGQKFSRLAVYLDKTEKLKSKARGALAYPAVVLAITGLVILALLVFVLPQFKEIFYGMKLKLPLTTVILLETSSLISNWWFLVLPVIFGTPFFIWEFSRTKTGSRLYDVYLLKFPVFGLVMRNDTVAKAARTLGTLLASGVSTLQALEVIALTAGNCVTAEAFEKARASFREGESIVEPLRNSNIIPSLVLDMITEGEATGELDKALSRIADLYDAEVDNAIKRWISIIEPAIILFMGFVIAGIVLTVFSPKLGRLP